MWGTYGDTSQNSIQLGFLVISVLCVPLMLLPKPLHEIYCQKKSKNYKSMAEDEMKDSGIDTFKSE